MTIAISSDAGHAQWEGKSHIALAVDPVCGLVLCSALNGLVPAKD